MRRRVVVLQVAVLAGVGWAGVGRAQVPQMPGQMPSKMASAGPMQGSGMGAGFSDGKLASGVKDALSVGTERAVKLVATRGGYLDNAAIKILLPGSLKPAEPVLRGAGQGPKLDAFVDSMNHAAESAAPEAEHIFGDAVRAMTVDDARKLLAGKDTAITDYFRDETSGALTTAFRPHVETAMNSNGVTQQYKTLAGSMPSMPFMGGGGSAANFDITDYVVRKALDGLFYMLAQQEKEIRTNPAARSTALLREVFGH